MTDNEIIKALKICSSEADAGWCDICPYEGTVGSGCSIRLISDTIDLITRQKAEISDLNAKNEIAAECIARQDKEIEELRKISAARFPYIFKVAGEHAIEEFALRLCEGRVSNDPVVIAVKTELEMVGES